MARRPHPGVVVLEVEAGVHARFIVGRRDQAGERRPRLRFEFRGKAVIAPGCAHGRLRAGIVAMGEPGARKREGALGAQRRLGGEKADGRLRVGLLLPQRRLGAPANVTMLGQLGLAAMKAA